MRAFCISRCQTISDSTCETQDSSCDFRTLFVTPTDSIYKVKTNIPTEEARKGRKAYKCRKVYKSDGTNTVLYDGPNGSLFFSYYFTIPNSGFRILNSEFRILNSEICTMNFGIRDCEVYVMWASGNG